MSDVKRSIFAMLTAATIALGGSLLPGAMPVAEAVDGAVSGTVTAAGSPLDDIQVTAYRRETSGWGWWGETETDPSGAYELSLSPGTYVLGFVDPDDAYAPEYFDGVTLMRDATEVVVGDGATVTGRDASLVPSSHLTGAVRSPVGGLLRGIAVLAYTQVYDAVSQEYYWSLVGDDTTATDGLYDVAGLAAGDYVLSFYDEQYRYRSEFFQNVRDIEAATPLTVAVSETRAVPDVTLDDYSRITGNVTTSAGAAAPGVEVAAYQKDLLEDYWYSVAEATSDAAGAYVLGGLEPGQYVVGFRDPSRSLASTYFPDSVVQDGATPVSVGEAATASGVNVALAPGASITGVVTAVSGAGVPYAEIWAYAWSGHAWSFAGSAESTATGAYVLGGLHSGTYRVEFQDWNTGVAEYWNDKSSLVTADDVALGVGARAVGISAEMDDKTTYRNLAAPAITGTPRVGVLLSATPGTWSPQGASLAFQWTAAGVPVPGAVGAVYVPSPADLGKQLTVRVTASGSGMGSGVAFSATTAPVVAATVPPSVPASVKSIKKPRIKGMAKVGKTLKVTAGRWQPSTVKRTFRWLANGKPIRRATRSRLTLGATLEGRKISVRIVASAKGYLPVTMTTKPTARVVD